MKNLNLNTSTNTNTNTDGNKTNVCPSSFPPDLPFFPLHRGPVSPFGYHADPSEYFAACKCILIKNNFVHGFPILTCIFLGQDVSAFVIDTQNICSLKT